MAKIFISHSSKDKAQAIELMQWLESKNFESLFLDSDARHGISGGSDWEKTLYREIRIAHAFIFLISDNWVNSQWCGFEFMQARALGKTIIPIRIQADLETSIASDIQHLDFSKDRNDALHRLQDTLEQLRRNTQRGFEWDSSRSPYPGMMAFEVEDAPVFFGRDAEIFRLRERLNQHRIQGSASVMLMLAASGAGKSSLLKAGLLPNLRHEKRQWIVLEPLRPEREPIRKLAQTLALATKLDSNEENTLCSDLQGEHATQRLDEILQKLRRQQQASEATVLLSIDQAEELFSTADQTQTAQLLRLLDASQTQGLPLLTLMAMRSDYLENWQTTNHTPETSLFNLEPLPLERMGDLIRGPAQVAGLAIDDGLITAATKDAATADALPLLAFALRELYERFGDDGDLTLDEYLRLGSEQLNPLENAVQQKAAEAIQASQLYGEQQKALREAFIPHLVRINDVGDYVRQSAPWHELPSTAHPLLDQLVNARLLIKRSDNGETRLEVAHEALLRHWTLLKIWLGEEHDFLLGKQQLEHHLRDWQALPKTQQHKGLLQGIALDRAQEWLFADRAGLSTAEKDLIRQSHAAETRKRKSQRNRLLGFVSMLIVVAALAVWQAITATKAEQQAEMQQLRTEKARQQAESVINFMVFDLRDKLQPIGRLDIMRDVQQRVATYYENSGEEIHNMEHLWQRATNRINRGGTQAAQGNLEAAEKLYREASEFMQQRADNDPSNAGWQRDLSVSLEKIGDILRAQGKLEEAKAVFEKDLAIAQTLADNDPSNAGWQRDLSVSLNKIGDILSAQGKLEEAKAVFEKDLAIAQTLADNDPSNAGWQTDEVVSNFKLFSVALQQDDKASAKQYIESALEILEPLEQQGLLNAQQQQWPADLKQKLSELDQTD